MKRSNLLFNPFGGSGSGVTSASTDATTSADVAATGASQNTNAANSVQAAPGSIAVGSGGQYREAGSTELSNITGNISLNDPKNLTALADDFANTTKAIAASAAQSNLTSNSAFLQGLQQLAMSQQTGGFSPVLKTFLWVALGGLVLLAFIFRKKTLI